jgi:hypothetical protein
MKRMMLLILVLFFTTGLAEDGCLGKAKFVAPQSPVKSLVVPANHYGSEEPDCRRQILWAGLQLHLPQFCSQSPKPLVQETRKIIFISYPSSAGASPGNDPSWLALIPRQCSTGGRNWITIPPSYSASNYVTPCSIPGLLTTL